MSFDVALVALGAAALGLDLLSDTLKRLWLSVPLGALVAGVLLGPQVLGVLEPEQVGDEYHLLEELARLTLALAVTSTALQLRRDDVRSIARPGAVLLSVVMLGMWAMTGLGAWLLLDVPFWVGALIGAILTPTDPVVAGTLVTGEMAEKNLPRFLRRTLQLESGANDGLAIVFVLLPALVISAPSGAARTWIGVAIAEVGLAIGVGLAVGLIAVGLMRFAGASEKVERSSRYAATIGLALLALGATHALGGSGVLAAFIAGLVFSLLLGDRVAELEESQSGVERLLIIAFFLLLGAVLPWSEWVALGVPGLLFAVWVLVLRRPPVAALALAPTRTPRRGVAFLSWYGPLGVAAVYYALLVERYGPEEHQLVFGAATLAIAASVLVHSVTATPGVRRYAGRSPLTPLRHPLRRGVDEAP